MSGNGASGEATGVRTDRRVRRTHHALRHALMELVIEKGYDRVTVQDVIDRADVGRSTFYAHFRDKEDLFLSGFEDEIRVAFEPGLAVDEERQTPGESPSLWLFRHAGEHRDLYQALVRRRGGWPLVRRRMEETLTGVFEGQLRAATKKESVPIDAAARFVASSLLGLLTWWLDEGMPADAEAIDSIFRALASHGTKVELGVEF